MTEWISVEDRLPVNNEIVLVLSQTGDPKDYLAQKLIPWIFQGFFERSCGWRVFFHCQNPTVSHWMPLPKPPEDL